MKIPFVGPSYQARSLNVDAQRALNCFVEMDDASPRAPVALYGTPGLLRRLTLPQGPVRGCIYEPDFTIWVAGNGVYMVDGGLNVTSLGTIGTSTGSVSFASSRQQILLVDGVAGYSVTLSAVTPIADPDFPNGVTSATWQDGYFIVAGNGTDNFWISSAGDLTQWDPLDFATAEGSPDFILKVISDHRELWLFGEKSVEVWINTGNADFPFERSGNVFVQTGTVSAASVVQLDNTLYWLGKDDRGPGIVWKMSGYTPQRISTHAVEKAIQNYAFTDDAIAFSYQQEGHSFYVLTFPQQGATWVFDVATQLWHERAWRDPNTAALTRWRPSCHVMFRREHLVGDFEDGRVYALDLDTFTDDGDPILRLRSAPTVNDPQDGYVLFFEELRIDMETGVGTGGGQGADPKLMMRYSNDGGHTWTNTQTKQISVGTVGKYGTRVKFGPTGAGRNRVWEISMTDPVKWVVMGAFARVAKGSS